MRLTQTLAMWPKKLPNGHIWTGKHKMVKLVNDTDKMKMTKDLKRVGLLLFPQTENYILFIRNKQICIFV